MSTIKLCLTVKLNSKIIWPNQTLAIYISTTAPKDFEKNTVQKNTIFQLLPQYELNDSTVNDPKNNTTASNIKDSVNIKDKEFPSPIEGVDFFNTERPINMSMYNETIVSWLKFIFFEIALIYFVGSS